MATWASLSVYVHSRYKVAEEKEGMMVLNFDLAGGRSQRVFIFRATLLDGLEEWAQIEFGHWHGQRSGSPRSRGRN